MDSQPIESRRTLKVGEVIFHNDEHYHQNRWIKVHAARVGGTVTVGDSIWRKINATIIDEETKKINTPAKEVLNINKDLVGKNIVSIE